MIYYYIFLINAILAFFLYINSPLKYDNHFCNICLFSYFIAFFCFLKIKKKKNYLDFDILFLITSFFLFFFFPSVVYPISNEDTSTILFDFNPYYINQGTSLATIGLIMYCLGSFSYRKKDYHFNRVILKSNSIALTGLISFCLYILLGGWEKMRNMYADEKISESGPSEYFFLITTILALCIIIVIFNNESIKSKEHFRIKNIPWLQKLFLSVVFILMLIAGSRTVPIQIALSFICLYAFFYRNFSLKSVFVIFSFGTLLMFLVLILRSNLDFFSISDKYYTILLDLYVGGRNTYDAINYVAVNGLTFGSSMLSPLLSPIPLLQQIIFNIFNIDYLYSSSAYLFTTETLGRGASIGVGTNIIADLYISFGLIGVIIGMFLFGRLIEYLKLSAKDNMYSLICYGVLLSYAVYLVRAEFLFPFRAILWCIIIFNILKNYKKYSIKRFLEEPLKKISI